MNNIEESDSRAHATWLKSYFSGVGSSLAAKDQGQWTRGSILCERWLRLMDSAKIDDAAIEAFLDEVYAELSPGSGWCEMSFRFKQWARIQGFAAHDRKYNKA